LSRTSSSASQCRCCRFTYTKAWASAPLSSDWSLISRLWAGHHADSKGAKQAVVIGLLVAAAAGLIYLLSLGFVAEPETSVTILLLGRALLGAAESFIVTGALSWGLALAGPQNTGKVMAWVGTAMYVAYAVGAPAGTALYAGYGFAAIALATVLIPLVTLVLVALLRPVAPVAHARPPFTSVIGAVWVPGLGLALSAVGFGAITTFIVLVFAQHGWDQAWLALTVVSIAFTIGRVVFGHMPDSIGGARIALVCVLIEAAGQALIWLAPWSALALVGAALTGFGYSLVYPGFGVEAVRRAPPESRGLAMGAYTAFLDLSLGLASPALGLVATRASLDAVFLASTLVVLCAAVVAVRLLYAPRLSDNGAGLCRLRDCDHSARMTKMRQAAARLALCAALIAMRPIYAPFLSDNKGQMAAVNGRFGLVIDTVPDVHDLNPYLPSLSPNGTLVLAGFPANVEPAGNSVPLMHERQSEMASNIGGIAQAREPFDFCSKRGINSPVHARSDRHT
jgi:MFS family permease